MIQLLAGRLLRMIIGVFFRVTQKSRLVVLTYHRVKHEDDPLQVDDTNVKQFELHIKTLNCFFHVLKLHDAVARLQKGTLPGGAICITFDDGYANNHDVALPVLVKHRTPATFFIAGGFLNGGCMWNDIVTESVRRTEKTELGLSAIGLGTYYMDSLADKAQAIESIQNQLKYRPMQQRLQDVRQLADIAGVTIPTDLMMTDTQIRNLHNSGMEIGGHTMNHPILTQIGIGQAREEISTNKQQLETLIGRPITSFAYPNGQPERDFDQAHIQMLRDCGYQAAVTTAWGSAASDGDSYQIPRISSWDQSAIKLVLRVIKAYFENPGKTLDYQF